MSSLSTFLNGREPTQLRGLQWLALSETGYVLTGVSTSDDGGGATVVWGTAGTVACRVDPIGDRGASRVTGGRIDERSTHVITMPAGAALTTAGQIVVSGRGTFEVTTVRERTGSPVQVFEVFAAS